ncbi:izumo sperm-egg fusion protein 1 isoform X4 [Narcine bancroftii]|uniref:izumo sperm-egg fusion protein 1 isoform X4 n=1 Tax=Narcine bancroftii TaxID=1343680 RepID=UPI00383205E6
MLALVLLVFLALMKGSDGCLLCSRALKEALRELREHHVPDRSQGYDQKRAQTALDELVRTYQRYDFMAQYILDRLTIDLKREIVGIIKQNLKGIPSTRPKYGSPNNISYGDILMFCRGAVRILRAIGREKIGTFFSPSLRGIRVIMCPVPDRAAYRASSSAIRFPRISAHFLAAAVINFGFKAHEIITMETNHFTNNIECSNSCGNFTLLFRQCIDCHPLFISCMMGIRCGATDLMVGENDELSLDCFQTWHKITSNFKSYIFSQAPLVGGSSRSIPHPPSVPVYIHLPPTVRLPQSRPQGGWAWIMGPSPEYVHLPNSAAPSVPAPGKEDLDYGPRPQSIYISPPTVRLPQPQHRGGWAWIMGLSLQGSRNEWQFQKIAETHESSLEILQVSKEHEKTYQCVVMGNEGRPIAKILYNVRVTPPSSGRGRRRMMRLQDLSNNCLPPGAFAGVKVHEPVWDRGRSCLCNSL